MIDYEKLEMERELRVKQLFEETITIPIEKYDDLLKKAGKLEHILFYDKKLKELEAMAEQNDVKFDVEVLDE